jgi:hypothetical protein
VGYLLLGGCLDSSSVKCGFGLCPEGSTCDETAKTCIPAGCGDGVISGDEQCDGTVNAAFDCTSFGFYQPDGLKCSSSCQLDTSACAQTCGDFEINGPETCDGIPPVDQTCSDYGFQIGRLGCSEECAPSFAGCESIGWRRGIGNALDDLHAVWGANPNDMYAVGNAGAILHSTGGLWSPQVSGTTVNLYGVWGASPNDVYIVGGQGTILHSTDGATWTPMAVPVTATLRAISGSITPTQIQIWAVGEQGTILTASYAPGGSAVWTQEGSGTTAILRGVWAQNTQFVVAVGDAPVAGTASPTALRRELATGGWSPIATPTIQPANLALTVALNGVWGSGAGFVAAGDATVASGAPRGTVMQFNGTQFVYTGQSLSTRNLLSVWGVVSVLPEDHTKTRTDIFIGGDGGTVLHYTGFIGSASFDQFELHTTLGVPALWGTGPAYVRAAMYGGGIMDYDGTDLSTQTIAPDVRLQAVWHDPVTNITIAAGEKGTIVRRDFSGWAAPATVGPNTGTFASVLGFGTTVFACGISGSGIVQSANSGSSWTAPVLGAYNFHGLWGLSATSAWAVGNNGHVSHYTGTTWPAPIVIGGTTPPDLYVVWGTSDTDIFVAGALGYIAHYDGVTWTQMASGEAVQTIFGMWGSASNDLFVIGGAGLILHYDGVTWRRMTSNTGADLEAIGGTGHGDVFIGGRDVLLHYIGNSWAPMSTGIDDVFGLWSEKQDSYFVGSGDVARVRRTELDVEGRCGDAWDNDEDGLANCADADCYAADQSLDVGCAAGGSCGPTTPLTCGYVSDATASNYTGIARIDDLPCLDHATPGPEASYRLIADHDGMIVVTLDDPGGRLDLVQLDPFDGTRTACDVGHCSAAPTSGDRSVMVNAVTGGIYYFVVDGPEAVAETFTLSVTCP